MPLILIKDFCQLTGRALVFTTLAAFGQTNQVVLSNPLTVVSNSPAQTNPGTVLAQRVEDMRAVCIQNRRLLCGKILKVLPDGLVVDSGYTNLLRAPLNQAWLIPGTAVAARPPNLVEDNQPGAICVGLVFLTDVPKSPGAKPQVFDYVNLEGFPLGHYTYTSAGDLQRTVRKFTAKIANSVRWNFEAGVNPGAPPK